MIRAAALLAASLAAAGCSAPGAMLAPAPAGLAAAPPAAVASDVALVVYERGSAQEFAPDRCRPGPATTPPAIRALAGTRLAGYRIAVYADCTPTRIGGYVHHARAGTPKVDQRAADIAALVDRLGALGLPPRRIVVAGHSAGAWAALRAVADGEPAVAGVIALAPAFAGPLRSRSPGWQWLRDTQARALARSARLPALVFAFAGDAYERPADLAFLAGVDGTEVVAVDPGAPAFAGCAVDSAHRAAFTPCFAAGHGARIRAFVGARLAAAAGPGEQSRP